jgi:SAM-dependent methyltransferase
MRHFTLSEAARRYDEYRPKVHGIAKEWINDAAGKSSFGRGIDVACGTGDSTKPLVDLCDQVIGVDASQEMLKFAEKKGLHTLLSSYEDIEVPYKFDLITTCMAFHWFDPAIAVEKFKSLSEDGALWLIYNFVFMGAMEDRAFNTWMMETYLVNYPSPPRGKYSGAVPTNDSEITVLKESKGHLELSFTREELIRYLTTQSNIEAVVKTGKSYGDIEIELDKSMPIYEPSQRFRYSFTYGVYQYNR